MLLLKYLLTASLVLASTSVRSQTVSKRPEDFVTVCDVLAKRGFYNGKVVALIGWWSPTDEGSWLAEDCEIPPKTGDYVWSNIIYLAYDPSSPSIFAQGSKLNLIAANKKISELPTRNNLGNDTRGWAVVYGRVETKEKLPTVIMGDGRSVSPAGYGHLNAAPAQIVYREKDLVIIPRNRD